MFGESRVLVAERSSPASAMADYELALSSGPSVKDLSFVWAPETGLPQIQNKKSEFGVLAKYKPQDVLQEKNLVDGLYVPPLDQKKLRKLAVKNVKETSGSKWYEWVAGGLGLVVELEWEGFWGLGFEVFRGMVLMVFGVVVVPAGLICRRRR